ncbi:SDR family NAD(P)-dependent oxidoreductase [Paenibacillus wynnii]|uniref:Ketoreductase domain-containing protein n=1 Tax=Paenibacillus wynnii TaxID=268407 RepID=A0A098M9K1_9BACL|nr:SDR family oxidoreductase [Paenibacillus wynnii]KGE18731.1 hypothetical protein PWYN_04620 [Paenibacillus wynnii]
MDKKVVFIVGGTSGIGLSTAELFVKQGNIVIATGRSGPKMEEALVYLRQFQQDDNQVRVVSADAADRNAMEAVFQDIDNRYGRLDVLVHVAGISGRKYGDGVLDECTDEGWEVIMANNLKSVYLSNQLALQRMKAQNSGNIVNISSILGLVGTREHFTTHAYAASRGAVIQLTRSAAVYYSKYNIRMNVVCPGLLDTPMSQRAVKDEVILDALTYLQPLSPHVGYPEDVAEAVIFLASDSAKFITGVVLPVDGGWTAQ